MTTDHILIVRRFGRLKLAGCLLLAGTQIAAAQQQPKNFVMHETSRSIAAIAFEDGQGQPHSLTDFQGKIVLLNIWATWCGPCRREMPALDRLQAALGGSEFTVVALSIDRAGIEPVRKFYSETGIRNLAIYIDASGKSPRVLNAIGVPTTFLIDREGRELGRVAGPVDWDAPEMVAFISCIISGDDAAQSRNHSKPTATPPCGERSLGFSAGGTGTNSQQ
ncbi:MAG: TlpA family protein disulfide reductase [Rhizobiales bacterium]|nr:TlpA family protein disulfide reductase [Hyphomicrobiales bacterium]